MPTPYPNIIICQKLGFEARVCIGGGEELGNCRGPKTSPYISEEGQIFDGGIDSPKLGTP